MSAVVVRLVVIAERRSQLSVQLDLIDGDPLNRDTVQTAVWKYAEVMRHCLYQVAAFRGVSVVEEAVHRLPPGGLSTAFHNSVAGGDCVSWLKC